MIILTNFNQPIDGAESNYQEMVPDHTIEALDHYFIKGFKPGGFVTAMIVEDWKKALNCADSANRQRFWYIATWLMRYAPKGSTGSYEAMDDWLLDRKGIRSTYVDEAEKVYEWRTLSGEVIACHPG